MDSQIRQSVNSSIYLNFGYQFSVKGKDVQLFSKTLSNEINQRPIKMITYSQDRQ
jgi:hypothetical protein